jgi:hypothetical protein
MQITKDEALDIAKQNISQMFHIEITDEWDSGWKVYQCRNFGDCWYISMMPAFSTRISSSFLIAISKDTGEIIYSGSANDEG